jgi:hypothetical protein
VRVVAALLRFFGYLYHGIFALLMVLFGLVVAVSGGSEAIRLDVVPWTGTTLMFVFLLGGIFGLLTVFLAIRGAARPLFFLWALLVTIFLVRGYFFGTHHFTPEEFTNVLYLTIGSIIALLGAFAQMFRPVNKKKK